MPDQDLSIHPTRTLTTPEGDVASIDIEMVPVVRALWGAGLTTLGCCQDSGEYAGAVRSGKPERTPTGHAGYVEYFRGWAWLKMPLPDTIALTNALAETDLREAVTVRWRLGSWRMSVPLLHDEQSGMELAPAVQIHLPRNQLGRLAELLPMITSQIAPLAKPVPGHAGQVRP